MPRRPIEQPNKVTSRFQAPKGLAPMQVHTSATIGAGMVTSIDPADIKPEAVQLSLNSRLRFDKTARRYGSVIATPVKPDSNPVLHIGFLKMPDDSNQFVVRITRNTVNYRPQGGTWQACAGTLNGSDTDGIMSAVVILPSGPPYYVFTNNGINEIQKIDFVGNTFSDLRAGAGVSTKYRYITGFYNRIFGAALAGTNECQIGWSADGVITEWDPSINQTAGNGPLIDTPDDESDFIKGIFGFTNVMIILRTKSIWHGTKLPIPTQPINFYAAIPGIGCDCPYSVKVTTEGLAWVDTRTATVWSYTPGRWPEPIGRPIEKELINAITNPDLVFGSYDAKNFEYTVAVLQPNTTQVLFYTYNFRNSGWTKDTRDGIATVSDGSYQTGGLTIGQLLGDIGDLSGTIGSLGATSGLISSRMYGTSSGDIWLEASNATMDGQATAGDNTGSSYETDIVSKVYTLDYADEYIARVRIDFIPYASSTLSLYFSKDGGHTWVLEKTTSFTSNFNVAQIFTVRKSVRTRRFAWKLTSSVGNFDVLGYDVQYYPGAESRV